MVKYWREGAGSDGFGVEVVRVGEAQEPAPSVVGTASDVVRGDSESDYRGDGRR